MDTTSRSSPDPRPTLAPRETIISPGIHQWLSDALDRRTPIFHAALTAFATGDWGDLDDHDVLVNELSIPTLGRVLASYPFPSDELPGTGDDHFWVLLETGHQRRVVTLPSES